MDINKKSSFTLGEIQVSPSHNQLVAQGRTVKLQPKVMGVLHYLACNHERVISNEELIERLWEGRVVTHGSVQKSINALRSAFCELIGEQELIAHYSKRGYQLTVTPQFTVTSQFLMPNQPDSNELPLDTKVETNQIKKNANRHRLLTGIWISVGVLLVIAAFAYYFAKPADLIITKNHKTTFQTTIGYTHETGHERNAVPHPDNQHLAYVREKFNVSGLGETQSELVVRNQKGADWRITTSNGSWFKLAWSPAGKHLAAIEIKRNEGQPYTPNFYEKPNYLYSFHIFSLDLAGNRLLEKQQLSQWQGRIYSLTWWDENTLEFVAKQGTSTTAARYRYSIQDQRLSQLDDMDGAANLMAGAVLNKQTALASLHKNRVQIDFLNEKQVRLSRWQLNVALADISWIPDGSGVLVYSEDTRRLFTLYRDGQQVNIPLADTKDRVFSRPRYQSDGAAIFYTEEKRSSNILLVNIGGTKTRLTENTDLNYAASFSPDGEKVVYASVRNNQTHLWLIESGQERQLTTQAIDGKVLGIVWSKNGEYLVYSAGNHIYSYSFLSAETSLVLSDTDKVEPIAYFPDSQVLILLKSSRDLRNLWRINTQTQQQKQLSFGSVGSAIEYGGDVFFQYASENGLWVLRNKNDVLEQLAPSLNENAKLLRADEQGIYFIDGGLCRESDIQYFNYVSGVKSTSLVRDNKIVSTTAFHPNRGSLQTDCYLAEANIVLLK
ncbi:MAG TPA: winged helix-turn-helix domain-containing protein [Cellvibrio sp.]|nr:winged helix-turn-helix domain-containing protein [Cellvibrio sp.]